MCLRVTNIQRGVEVGSGGLRRDLTGCRGEGCGPRLTGRLQLALHRETGVSRWSARHVGRKRAFRSGATAWSGRCGNAGRARKQVVIIRNLLENPA